MQIRGLVHKVDTKRSSVEMSLGHLLSWIKEFPCAFKGGTNKNAV